MQKRPRDVADDAIIFTDDSSDDDTQHPIALIPKRKVSAIELEPEVPILTSAVSIDPEDMSLLEQRLRQLLVEDASPQQRVQTSPVLAYLLRTHCNLPSGVLRSGQEEVVRSILHGQSVLALFPTGYGKSLCYQLPMLVHRLIRACEKHRMAADSVGGTIKQNLSTQKFAVVISPLLALISDQLGSIRRQDAVHAISITSNTGRDMEDRIYRTLSDGERNDIDIVLVSPEAFVTKHRLRLVLRDCFDRIAFVCIDEAHCISSWSHDFRPTYLYLRKSLTDLKRDSSQRSPPILALTATAPATVVSELRGLLRLDCVVDRMQPRDNIVLQSAVLPPLSMPVTDRMRDIQEQVLHAVKELAHPMLIYAPTQVQVDELSAFLRRAVSQRVEGRGVLKRRCNVDAHPPRSDSNPEASLEVVSYHAGLPQSQRTIAQRRFLTGDADILVATVAFGMGIDKANIRSVVHCTAPSSLAAYSQETGRAGRDGAQSICRTIYDVDDFFLLRRKALTHLLSFSDVRKIVTSLFTSQTTTTGLKFLAISTEQIAGEVGCSSATVETLMYLLLISHPLYLAALEGKVPLSFRVGKVDASCEADDDPNVPPSTAANDPSLHSSVSWAEQRRREQHRRYDASLQGVLKQLDVSCEVEQLCRTSVRTSVPSIVQASNDASLSVEDFLFRLRTLEASRTVSVRWSNYGFLLRCGPSFPPSSEVIQLIAKEMFQKLKARLLQSVTHLHDMFAFLERPSQAALLEGLARSSSGEPPQWQPPAPRITRMQAVDIASQFVSENRVRIRNATEVVKALAGIAPTMSGGGNQGDGAALAPLTGSWYLRHPHFGALQDFDLEWIMKVVAAHALPE